MKLLISPLTHADAEDFCAFIEALRDVRESIKHSLCNDRFDIWTNGRTCRSKKRHRAIWISNEARVNFGQSCFADEFKGQRCPKLILAHRGCRLSSKCAPYVSLRFAHKSVVGEGRHDYGCFRSVLSH